MCVKASKKIASGDVVGLMTFMFSLSVVPVYHPIKVHLDKLHSIIKCKLIYLMCSISTTSS